MIVATPIYSISGIKLNEGLILDYRHRPCQIFLTHGHQADILNDSFWRLSRFLVRYLWRPLELIGIRDPTSAAKNSERKSKVERRLASWSDKNNQMIITGHTHRPVFPKPEKYYILMMEAVFILDALINRNN